MTTPNQPEPNTGRILEPTSFSVKKFTEKRVYPDGRPDDYGQVSSGAKDRSQLGEQPSPSEEQHYHSDADSAMTALHHTLGTGRTQASPGNHIHDGTTSVKMGPLEMDPGNPGQTRPALTLAANAADIRTFLHNFFNFRDV